MLYACILSHSFIESNTNIAKATTKTTKTMAKTHLRLRLWEVTSETKQAKAFRDRGTEH